MATDTIDVGTVDNAKELVFSAGDNDRRYVLQAPCVTEDYVDFIGRFPKHSVKRTTRYYIDDTDGKWFACYNVDCFDPPFAIVRARSFETAYEVFCDEFEDWLKVDDSDAKDYPEDDRHYNGNGTHIDTDNVQLQELTLVTVSVA
jgi:hypothetical protein